MTTARSRGLGIEVRKLRKNADLRLEELSDRCGWSRATLGRIEAGTRVPTETETAIILGTLGVTGAERERILELAQGADEANWWEVSKEKVPAHLVTLMDFERNATKVTDVALGLVPGLLQIADYTRAVISAGGIRGENLETRVSLRLGRQGILTGTNPVIMHAVLDEAVLHRPVGGIAVMCEQLRHLGRMARKPNITIQVIPFAAGSHTGLNGSQLLLEFQRQRAIVHLEHRRSSVFLDDPAETSRFFESMPSLMELAMSPAESVKFIAARAAELEGSNSDHALA